MSARFFLIPILILAAAVPALQADSFALNFLNKTGPALANPPFTLGFRFSVTGGQDLYATALAFFDSSQNGLAESHKLGLWSDSGTLLASATVKKGTGSPLEDKFRVVDIPDVLLHAGQTYRLGALFVSGADPVIFKSNGLSTDPNITFLSEAFGSGGSLMFPDELDGGLDSAYFGPNLKVAPVPEPSSILLLSSLVAGLGLAISRNRHAV